MRKANAARIQIVLHRTKNSCAVRRKGGIAGKNAALAAPQAGRSAVAQQFPPPGGQGNGAGGFGGVIKDTQGAPCCAVAPDGGQRPAHQRLLQCKELQSLRGVTVGAAQRPGKPAAAPEAPGSSPRGRGTSRRGSSPDGSGWGRSDSCCSRPFWCGRTPSPACMKGRPKLVR